MIPARPLVLAVLLAASVASCAIEPEKVPNPLSAERGAVFGDPATGDEATGSQRIYLLSPADPDEPPRLRSVPRDVSTNPAAVLQTLFAGPNATELDEQLETAIPAGVELLSARTVGEILSVDLGAGFGELTTDGLRLAVAQIVTTATSLDRVRAVQLRIEGEPRVWPLGNGELTDRPLTVYDYPGLVESSQPAFPTIPTPSR